jgi:hypothetical protein
MEHRIQKGIFIFLIAILFLPSIQQMLSVFPNGVLFGTFQQSPNVQFSTPGWIDKSFQASSERYVNDRIGFRPFIIKANNQVDFTLFGKFHSSRIVKGKDNCFFTQSFLDAYMGKGFEGSAAVKEKLKKFKAIQDTLSRLGKSLLLAYAPDKEDYYPEYLPSKYTNAHRAHTSFATYKSLGDSMGVNQLDFNTWFVCLKNTSKEHLYPMEGIHWSSYGALLAADSLIRYIEHLRHIQMLHPVWDKVAHTHEARYYDDDISKGLNLLFPVSNEVYSYPELYYTGSPLAIRPNAIYIGDSYFIPWIRQGVMDNVNQNWQLWYYNKEVWERYNQQDLPKKTISEIDWLKELNNADYIVMMYTAANLPRLGDGFIEQAYIHFYPGAGIAMFP